MDKHTLMDVADVLVFIDSVLDKLEKNGTITREANIAVYNAVYKEFFPGKEEEVAVDGTC